MSTRFLLAPLIALPLVLATVAASAAPTRRGPKGPKAACLAAHEEGQSLRTQKKPHAAHEKFVACARAECPLVVRKECTEQVTLADQDGPTVALEAHDANGADVTAVKVSLDDQPLSDRLTGAAVDVEPGEHEFRFERPDGKVLTVHALIVEGEKNRKVVADFATLEPKRTSDADAASADGRSRATVPVASYVLGGMALVAAGGFVYFAATGKSDEHHLASSCGPHCTDAEVHPVKTSYLAADVSLAVGVVALATAVILAWPALTGGKASNASVGGPLGSLGPPPWMPHVTVRSLP